MTVLFSYLLLISAVIVPLVALVEWVRRKSTALVRDVLAFILALLAGFCASFALYLLGFAYRGNAPETVFLPILNWVTLALILHSLALRSSLSRRILFVPYVLNALCLSAASATRAFPLWLVSPLLLIALLLYLKGVRSITQEGDNSRIAVEQLPPPHASVRVFDAIVLFSLQLVLLVLGTVAFVGRQWSTGSAETLALVAVILIRGTFRNATPLKNDADLSTFERYGEISREESWHLSKAIFRTAFVVSLLAGAAAIHLSLKWYWVAAYILGGFWIFLYANLFFCALWAGFMKWLNHKHTNASKITPSRLAVNEYSEIGLTSESERLVEEKLTFPNKVLTLADLKSALAERQEFELFPEDELFEEDELFGEHGDPTKL